MDDNNTNIDSGMNSDLIGVQLDTLADLLDWEINQYDKRSELIGNCFELDDQAVKLQLHREGEIRTAIKNQIDSLQTECNYFADRCDKGYSRYKQLIRAYYDTNGEEYIPERGEDWHPNWGTEVQYDPPEPTWDAVSRHDSNEGW